MFVSELSEIRRRPARIGGFVYQRRSLNQVVVPNEDGGMFPSDEILIAGAGIGGLATALSLHDAGFAVRIFESVTEIKPLGVGINLLPHAVRELEEMGLRERLERAGVACRELSYYTKRGERIWGEPRGISAGYRWPQISVHRGALQLTCSRPQMNESAPTAYIWAIG